MSKTTAAILAVAAGARLFYLLAVGHPELLAGSFEVQADTDEGHYHAIAATLASEGRYAIDPEGPPTALRPPGTIVPIAGLYALFGADGRLALALVLVASLLIVPAAGLLASAIAEDRRTAGLAMLGAALMPTLIFTSGGIWTDPPAILFTLLALWLVIRARAQPDANRLWLGVGLALAAAYLNRPSAGFVILLLLADLGLAALRRRPPALRHWKPVVLVALAALLPVAAWAARNSAALGAPILGNVQSTIALWLSNNAVTAGLRPPVIAEQRGIDLAQEAARGAYLGSWVPSRYIDPDQPLQRPDWSEVAKAQWCRDQVRSFVRAEPAAFVKLLFYKARRLLSAEPAARSVIGDSPAKRRAKRWVTLAERWTILLLGGWGLVVLARRRSPALRDLVLFATGGLVVVFLAYASARIFLPVAAVLIVPAAMAVDDGWRRFVRRATPATR